MKSRPIVELNCKYTNHDGSRVLLAMYYTMVRDSNQMIVEGIRLLEDIPGQPLPVTHDRPLAEFKQLILDGRLRAVS